MILNTASIILLGVLLVMLLTGFPIVWAMCGASIACIMFDPGQIMMVVPKQVFTATNNFAFLAVPCFFLCGDIMSKGGLSSRLCKFCNALVGWIHGGLSLVTIVACAIFAAVSGSAVATTAAIGGIMHPEMVKAKYPSAYTSAIPAVAGTLGIIIPPSIVFVIYGSITQTSISLLLMAGVVPGVVCAICLCINAYVTAKRRKYPVGEPFTMQEFWSGLKGAIWAIIMPLIILGGIYAGVCTPTESSAIACLYGGLVCLLVYRELRIKTLIEVIQSTVVSVATLMMLTCSALVVGYLLTVYNIPTAVATWFLDYVTSSTGFILITIGLLLVCGMFLDVAANNLILAPLFAPIAISYGMDPVHFGLIFVFMLALGQATPPFGSCLFVACALNDDPLTQVAKEAIPFMLVELGCILVFAFVPAISMWLPRLIA